MSWKFAAIDVQAREIIYNVHQFMRKEAKECEKKVYSKEYFSKMFDRTAQATGVSKQSVSRILKEAASCSTVAGRVIFAKSKRESMVQRPSKEPPNLKLEKKDYIAIEEAIRDFFVTKKRFPTLKYLLSKLKKEMNFPGNIVSLRRIVNELDYNFIKDNSVSKKTQNDKDRTKNVSVQSQAKQVQSPHDTETRPHIDILDIKEEKIQEEEPSSSATTVAIEPGIESVHGITFINDPIPIKLEVMDMEDF